MKSFIGVDYGSKLAGTTALCFEEDDTLVIRQSKPKEDADQFIMDQIVRLNPEFVYIDAPLSLPAAYFGNGDDFMYRHCDRLCGAMSPMFLGGLTARALSLSHLLKTKSIICLEVYPAKIAEITLPDKRLYNKKSLHSLLEFCEWLKQSSPVPLKLFPENWHQADSWLAWYSGWRHQQGIANTIGNEDEGLIWV